jgi:hypothetical protein
MIPKPPFPWDLEPEAEIAAFEALKPRLASLWSAIFPGDDEDYTSVVVPSQTLDQAELQKIAGVTFYEERLLFLLIRLRNPRARVVYVTSQPIHPLVLEYYFQLLAGIPASHARARLTLLCAHDSSPRSLTEKILERPRLLQRIRAGIPDVSRAYLSVFNATPLERKLSVLLDIPLNGVDPQLLKHGTKSGSRRIFQEAGVACPAGIEDIHGESETVRALAELARMRPGIRRAVVKLDESFSGEGNALYTYPTGSRARPAIERAMGHLIFAVPAETRASYFSKLQRMGGIVEELLEGREVRSPSAQLRVNPRGAVILVATHDQILGGPMGHTYLGCRFPAADDYRLAIQDAGVRVGTVLASKGVVSRFGVDFVVRRAERGNDWDINAIEINLRMGGTTHPFLALRFLTAGQLDVASGLFRTPSGLTKYYRSTDNLCSPAYRGVLPEDLIDILTVNRLHYDQSLETGVLFHLMGAVSEFGKLGLTAIGNSLEEVEALYARTLETLDRETACNIPPATTRRASS